MEEAESKIELWMIIEKVAFIIIICILVNIIINIILNKIVEIEAKKITLKNQH